MHQLQNHSPPQHEGQTLFMWSQTNSYIMISDTLPNNMEELENLNVVFGRDSVWSFWSFFSPHSPLLLLLFSCQSGLCARVTPGLAKFQTSMTFMVPSATSHNVPLQVVINPKKRMLWVAYDLPHFVIKGQPSLM